MTYDWETKHRRHVRRMFLAGCANGAVIVMVLYWLFG